MENKRFNLSIEEARHLYNSNDEVMKSIALRAYSEDELSFDFTKIKTFEDACKTLGLNYNKCLSKADGIANDSKASAAMYKLGIVRNALNFGHVLHLTENPKDSFIFYPFNPLITNDSDYYEDELSSGEMEIIGKIRCNGEEYKVLGGYANNSLLDGFGRFESTSGVAAADTGIALFGCTSKEIGQHFGKYFGMLITQAKFGDIIEDFEIIEIE